jgi:beta-N-acetylhexosaminidase
MVMRLHQLPKGKSISRREVLRMIATSTLLGLPWFPARLNSELSSNVAELVMMGFDGSTLKSPSAQSLAKHTAEGRVGSIFFVKNNIGTRGDVEALIRLFKKDAPASLRLAIDHEGGIVQRLLEIHGFTPLPPPRDIVSSATPAQARVIYENAGTELVNLGFNINLAPVVDLDDPNNPAIGHYKRAFNADPKKVAEYARAFIEGFKSSGIVCALKHFPGHGHSLTDSHNDLPDITTTWSETELEPYRLLIESDHASLIMGGHLRLGLIEPSDIPTTLSKAVTTGLLRERLGFAGVIMTDDIDMVAISRKLDRQSAFIQALLAGNDLLMIRNVKNPDPEFPLKVLSLMQLSLDSGLLTVEQIHASAERVRRMKSL